MNQIYQMFEKQSMIRKPSQLVNPIVIPMSRLQLPRNSLLHYVSTSKIDVGPASNSPVFKDISKPILVYTPLELVDPPNTPRKVAFDPNGMIRGFFIKNRRFRRLTDLDKMPKDEKTLIVVNYSLIHHPYKYIRSLYSDYHEWQDMQYTIASTINEVANITQRQQFWIIDCPNNIPPVSRLKMASKGLDQTLVKLFSTHASRFLLHLWMWLDGEQFPNLFDRIDPKNYRYINFVFVDSDNWCCINMNRLHFWKRDVVEKYERDIRDKLFDPKTNVRPDKNVYDNFQLQKYVLRMMMVMASHRSVASIDADAENEVEQNKSDVDEDEYLYLKKDAEEDSSHSLKDGSDDDVPDTSYQEEHKSIIEHALNLNTKQDDGDSSAVSIDEKTNEQIENDLNVLETLDSSTTHSVSDDTEIKPLVVTDNRSYETKIKDRLAIMAEKGLITAGEYRRYSAIAETYKTIKDPLGTSKTMVEASIIPPEELLLDTNKNIAPNTLVLDEKMSRSVVEESHSRYIKTTMDKHLMQSFLSIQNAGIMLEDVKFERTENILGAKKNITVKLVPIEGAPTTWRFPIPEINEDGTFVSNGVKYSMRRQRGDKKVFY